MFWNDPPAERLSFALVCEDPDAPRGTWVHWVVYDMPPERRALEAGIGPDPELPDGTRQGTNDFGRLGYGGPAPPPGKPHRYFFKLYALDVHLGLEPGATRAQLLDAMRDHKIAEGQVVGLYGR